MSMTVEKARLEARVKKDIYKLIKKAASIQGGTLTNFIITTLYEKSKDIINQNNILNLSLNDQELFINSIDTFEVNDTMKNSLDEYDKYFSGE